MAWNPSPEVAVARDAAKRLANAQACIVYWVQPDGKHGIASYGKTTSLCRKAGELADALFDVATNWHELNT